MKKSLISDHIKQFMFGFMEHSSENILLIKKGVKRMIEKRFIAIDDGLDLMIKDIITSDTFVDAESVVDVLNDYEKENEGLKHQAYKLEDKIARLKFSKRMLKENIKDYERSIKRLWKSFDEFDEMRIDRIRFLENRLKKNGLSIYVNECGEEYDQLKQYKQRVFNAIDKRINTLEANSRQCHQGGNHEKGIEFTLQAELLERLKKELKE